MADAIGSLFPVFHWVERILEYERCSELFNLMSLPFAVHGTSVAVSLDISPIDFRNMVAFRTVARLPLWPSGTKTQALRYSEYECRDAQRVSVRVQVSKQETTHRWNYTAVA